MLCTITTDLFKGLKKIVSIGNLVDSLTWRVRESFFIINISATLKPNLEQLERKCKGLMQNRFLQKPQKIRLIVMSLYNKQKVLYSACNVSIPSSACRIDPHH
jgi:hypothetical protein